MGYEYWHFDKVMGRDVAFKKCPTQEQDEAIEYYKKMWDSMSDEEKAKRSSFGVAFARVDEDGVMQPMASLWDAKEADNLNRKIEKIKQDLGIRFGFKKTEE